jgi:hypothetical protein
MDTADREFAFLAASVERTARVQQQAAKEHLSSDPRRGRQLAQHLAAAYDALLTHTENRRQEWAESDDAEFRRGAIVEMRNLVAGARGLHSTLMWLDAAANPPLDLGSRYLIEQAARGLVSPDAEVTIVAATDRSYATFTNPLAPVFELSGASKAPSTLAIVVFVPRREQKSGLLHPLVIHELGHAADARHGLVGAVLEGAGSQSELQEALLDAATRHAEQADGDVAASADLINARLAAWSEEAFCDALAAQILGPTYLYSFIAVVGTEDLDVAGDEHPPTRLRVRLLLEHLASLSWNDTVATADPEIDAWCRGVAAEVATYDEPDVGFAVDALQQLAPRLRRAVAEHVGSNAFTSADNDRVSTEIQQLLQNGIPPAQASGGSAIPRAAIILGSWHFAIAQEGGGLSALATAPDVPELSRLLPKALEISALVDAWENP